VIVDVTLRGQDHDPNMFCAHYLENGWRYRLGYNEARSIADRCLAAHLQWERSRQVEMMAPYERFFLVISTTINRNLSVPDVGLALTNVDKF